MKTILIATDFSNAAHSAAVYAIELAKAFNARLMLFNAFQPVPVVVDVAPVTVPYEVLNKLTQDTLLMEEHSINPYHDVPVLTGFEEATEKEDAILQAAEDIQADLIVVGMKEHNHGMRKLFGSTVTALTRKTTIPLLVIPEGATYQPVKNIAIANENDLGAEADCDPLNSLREIATLFHSRVYMVRVAESEYLETCGAQRKPVHLTEALWPLAPVYECMEGADVTLALKQFIASRNIQLLAVMPHRLSRFERLFIRSVTRHLLFEINTPVLVLPNMV